MRDQELRFSNYFRVRHAIAAIRLEDCQPDSRELQQRICSALQANRLVSEVSVVEADGADHHHFFDRLPPSPSAFDLGSIRKFCSPGFSSPITFRIQAPNARGATDWSGLPREQPCCGYAVWDGQIVIVLWEELLRFPENDSVEGLPIWRSEGLPDVIEIVIDACAAVGTEVFLQDSRAGAFGGYQRAQALLARPADRAWLLSAALAMHVIPISWWEDDPGPAALRWYRNVGFELRHLFGLRNAAVRVRELASFAERRLEEALVLEQAHATAMARPARHRVRGRWRLRRWRRRSRELLADARLATATIAVLRGNWKSSKADLEFMADADGLAEFLDLDLRREAASVEEQRPELMHSTLTSFATRLDARDVVSATALAGAAAILGAVAGALLTLIA